MFTLARNSDRRALFAALLLIAAVTAWRLLLLALHPPLLSFDEAQYWAWAQTVQLGYYSKPPMVAWAIAATTALFGESEGAIKLASTLMHAGTALWLLALGRALWGDRVGAWAGVLWITLPAVSLSSLVITTDPFLLFFWAAAMLFLVRAVQTGPGVNRWWLALGLAFGLGLLGKYAMAFFLLGLAAWLAWDREYRSAWRHGGLWSAVLVGLLVYTPNAVWNARNGFVSYAHTRDNAHLGGSLFHPDKLAEFIGGQFGVAGPLIFLALIVGLVLATQRGADGRIRFLAAFCAPVLLVMAVESLLSRANANWTAPAYVSGVVLVAAVLARHRRIFWVLPVSLLLHLGAMGALYLNDYLRPVLGLPDTARLDPMKRIRGWDVIGAEVSRFMAENPGARLVADERKVLATLLYYVHPHPFDAIKWNPSGAIHDHFDQTTRLEPGEPLVLFVTDETELPPGLAERFESVERLADVRVPLHADYERRASIWRLRGFKGY